MPVSKAEKERSKVRLAKFNSQKDSVRADDAVFKRFKAWKAKGGKGSMQKFLTEVDDDSATIHDQAKNEQMRQNHFRLGQTAMDAAETKSDSTSVRKQREQGNAEGSILRDVHENVKFREEMAKRAKAKTKKAKSKKK